MGKAISYNNVKLVKAKTIKFKDKTFNEFLSADGGAQRSTMIALAGTSGAGKTTLCKKLQKDIDEPSVFFALESLKGSVARQTSRIKTGAKERIADEEDFPTWSAFMKYIHRYEPSLVIVDSLQHAAKLLSKENGKHKYANYETIIKDLYSWKDKTQGLVILIVQLNAEGKIEGPASTVFDVDCPMKMVANPKTQERYIISEKNRMGGLVGKPIFYEFVNTEEHIKFFTEDEWNIINSNLSLPEFMNKAIENYVAAMSKNKNYSKFRKELVKGYNKIYENAESELQIVSETMVLIDSLKHILE